MTKVKAAFGGVIAFALPLLLAVVFVGVAIQYAQQHVHNEWWTVNNTGGTKHHVTDYHHSTGGIIAATGAFLLLWAFLTALCVLIGGSMIAKRDKRWD